MKKIIKKIEDDKLLLIIDSEVYEKDAIIQATYKYTAKCYLNIELKNKMYEIYFISKGDKIDLEKLALEFGNEIIDQQVRLITGREFKEIREQLVKKAFASINR